MMKSYESDKENTKLFSTDGVSSNIMKRRDKMTQLFRLCEYCNKEFLLPDEEAISMAECPECKRMNHIWIRVVEG